jgi:hemerythrin-like domain-containing protein
MSTHSEPDLQPSYLEHRAIRVDAARLRELVVASRPADAPRLTALGDWYGHYERAIHDHHRAEEAVIYPALLDRDPSFADADGALEGEHRILIDRLAVVRESIAGLAAAAGGGTWERERDEAARAADALVSIVGTHLDHEEATAFPRYTVAFTADEFDRLGRTAFKLIGARSMVFAAPWVLDHTDDAERAALLEPQPLILRVIYRLVWRPKYHRLARPLRRSDAPTPAHPED